MPPFNIYLEKNRIGKFSMKGQMNFKILAPCAFAALVLAACSDDGSSSLDYPEAESSSSVESSSDEASSSSVVKSSSSVSSSSVSSSSVEESSSSQEPESSSSEQVFIDERDGQAYRYVVIGEQTWMAQNLNYTDTAKKYSYNYTPDIADPTIGRYYWDQDADSQFR